jgi:hypothetical protein
MINYEKTETRKGAFLMKFNGSTQLNLYFISYQQVFNSYMSISGVGFQQDQLLIIMFTLRNMK